MYISGLRGRRGYNCLLRLLCGTALGLIDCSTGCCARLRKGGAADEVEWVAGQCKGQRGLPPKSPRPARGGPPSNRPPPPPCSRETTPVSQARSSRSPASPRLSHEEESSLHLAAKMARQAAKEPSLPRDDRPSLLGENVNLISRTGDCFRVFRVPSSARDSLHVPYR